MTEKKCYVVGGAVRDVLLARPSSDIDYVWTGCTEQDFPSPEFEHVGESFPVFLDKAGNEHALARTERKSGVGYHGFSVDYTQTITIEEDLYRRDLTINAMAVPVESWDKFVQSADVTLVIDPHGGLADLANGLLAPVSNHFMEDPLRVVRALRFAANLSGFSLSGEVYKMADKIPDSDFASLSPERFYAELEKVKTPNVISFFNMVSKVEHRLWPKRPRVWKEKCVITDSTKWKIHKELTPRGKLALGMIEQSGDDIAEAARRFNMLGRNQKHIIAVKKFVDGVFHADITERRWASTIYDFVKRHHIDPIEMSLFTEVLVIRNGHMTKRVSKYGDGLVHLVRDMQSAITYNDFDSVKESIADFDKYAPSEYGKLVKQAVLKDFLRHTF